MKKIAIITPVKNEINNLKGLIKAIENQTLPIFYWVVVENDSDDGSKEFLELIKPNNVKHFQVINIEFSDKSYQLGKKYSSIISQGFSHVVNSEYYQELDFIGILDADCHPEPDYYKKLIQYFNEDLSLGIASGIIKYKDGTFEKSNLDHARGGCRLWRIECFENSPYEIGLSADSISEAKAILNGWKVKSFSDAIVESRKTGSRYVSFYSGFSAYYRYLPFYYVFVKSLLFVFKGEFGKSYGLFVGYIKAYFSKAERIKNEELKKYFKQIAFRKFRIK
jgi:glycosyltransferase involved in cell wall biosynthesis